MFDDMADEHGWQTHYAGARKVAIALGGMAVVAGLCGLWFASYWVIGSGVLFGVGAIVAVYECIHAQRELARIHRVKSKH